MSEPAVRLFVGGHAWTIQGELAALAGDRCFSAVHPPPPAPGECSVLLDSGAFSDAWEHRLTPAGALDRQLAWEQRAGDRWGQPVVSEAIVSYDLLIDEWWQDGMREKRRWTVAQADAAVAATIASARYLTEQRARLAPRRLVLSCQGVDAEQYAACAAGVLATAEPGDWLGLGGWCIIGRFQTWLSEFRRTMQLVVPMAARHEVRHVHLFGVLWEPAVAGLLWEADQWGVAVSVDSTAPLKAAAGRNHRKSGARRAYWRDNIAWWRAHLAGLRTSRWYRPAPVQMRMEIAA